MLFCVTFVSFLLVGFVERVVLCDIVSYLLVGFVVLCVLTSAV